MQISLNTTGFSAGLCVAVDESARDHCVVVIKGTFHIAPDGSTRPDDIQRPVVFADDHFGDPGTTSIRYECDFALRKPFADILVHGHAASMKPRERMHVRFDLAGRSKQFLVIGDRRWERGLGGLRASPPQPFTRMPLVFDRAFGGTDQSHPNAKYHTSDARNPVGAGFRANLRAQNVDGTPLPNIEDPHAPISTWTDKPVPIGCGVVGRAWLPRVTFAGTYDQRWLDEVAPFLPADFDLRHFQAAPTDQQVAHLRGGEAIMVDGMRERGPLVTSIPRQSLLVRYRFRDRDVLTTPVLDTVLVDCDADALILTWRSSAPLGKKLVALREIEVFDANRASARPTRTTRGKPHFAGIAACLAWMKTDAARKRTK